MTAEKDSSTTAGLTSDVTSTSTSSDCHLVECPLCMSFFPGYAIEIHASQCGEVQGHCTSGYTGGITIDWVIIVHCHNFFPKWLTVLSDNQYFFLIDPCDLWKKENMYVSSDVHRERFLPLQICYKTHNEIFFWDQPTGVGLYSKDACPPCGP